VRAMLTRGISSLRRAARFTGLSRSTAYYRPRHRPVRRPRADEPSMRAAVRRAALAHPTFGSRRVWAVLRYVEQRRVSWKRVRRLLKVEGLQHERHFPRPRVPESGNLAAARPNERWYTDLTYIDTTDEGPVPLMTILDGCTREAIVHELFRECGASDALSVVQRAVFEKFPETGRAPGTFLVSDGGPQFTAERFREGARALGLAPRSTRKKRPEDNGMIESFQGHFKHDYLWIREPGSFIETRVWVREGMTDYNTSRPHSSLNYLSPVEYAKRKATEVKE
jgi:putative transposase